MMFSYFTLIFTLQMIFLWHQIFALLFVYFGFPILSDDNLATVELRFKRKSSAKSTCGLGQVSYHKIYFILGL